MEPVDLLHAGIIALFLATFGEASLSKIAARETPQWFIDQFAETWMGKLPIKPMYWGIAIAELGVAGLMVASLVTGEFATDGEKILMSYALIVGVFIFSALALGLRVSSDFVGSANAFFYASATAGLWYVVHMLGMMSS